MLNITLSSYINLDITSVQGGRYKEEKAFASDAVADALKRHWTAIDHFENNGLADKVAKHVDGFKALLHHQFENDQISEEVYHRLMTEAESMTGQWG
ncbi:FIMAH domain-containing protein [Virgibacillus pantothenticus]|nr:hypothetical protein [Virgibacillus pantothenticus]GIP64478.1 hypothetical protein J32TS6_30330 [Virgibacillus pantothenticus]